MFNIQSEISVSQWINKRIHIHGDYRSGPNFFGTQSGTFGMPYFLLLTRYGTSVFCAGEVWYSVQSNVWRYTGTFTVLYLPWYLVFDFLFCFLLKSRESEVWESSYSAHAAPWLLTLDCWPCAACTVDHSKWMKITAYSITLPLTPSLSHWVPTPHTHFGCEFGHTHPHPTPIFVLLHMMPTYKCTDTYWNIPFFYNVSGPCKSQ